MEKQLEISFAILKKFFFLAINYTKYFKVIFTKIIFKFC